MITIFIPVLFMCLNGNCEFMQAKIHYRSEEKCLTEIEELAEKANIEFTYDPTETPMRAFAECWADELEKFAELIVQECARIAIAKQTENDISGIVSKNPAKDFAYALVEHFGVEE
jgi:hypothetical protein